MHGKTEDMKKIGRLTGRPDFLRVQASGRKWVSATVIVQVVDNGGQTPPRFGLTVTKKSCDVRAVVRNRIRRRLRAAAYDSLPDMAQSGHDYVLIGRKATEVAPYDRLTADLKWCLKRLAAQETAAT